jgi:hypothetical protein
MQKKGKTSWFYMVVILPRMKRAHLKQHCIPTPSPCSPYTASRGPTGNDADVATILRGLAYVLPLQLLVYSRALCIHNHLQKQKC